MRCVANSQRHQSGDSRRTRRERERERMKGGSQREQVGAGGMKEKPKERREFRRGYEILMWT